MTQLWEKEFDKKFIGDNYPDEIGYKLHLEKIKHFVRELIEKECADAYHKGAIAYARIANEDKSTHPTTPTMPTST